MSARALLTAEERARLEAKIAAAEQRTTAQLKVVVAASQWLGLKRKARRIFHKFKLDQTAERNCVLVLLVPRNREFLIYGDEGIHQRVGQDYWNDVREQMAAELRAGRSYDALALGVSLLGDKLAALFPAGTEKADELSNQILFVA